MRVSLFESVKRAYVQEVIDGDWETIADVLLTHWDVANKDDCAMFNFAKFKDVGDAEPGRKYHYENGTRLDTFDDIPNTVRRCKNNLIEIDGIVLDVDANYTIENIKEKLGDQLEYIIFTTFRHQVPDEEGIAKDKFRVVIPFSRPLKAEDIKGRRKSIKDSFPGVDNASFSASQSFYLHSGPNPVTFHNKGVMIDPYLFDVEPERPQMPVKYIENDDEQMAYILNLLPLLPVWGKSGMYDTWREVAWGMRGAGYNIGDFIMLTNQVSRTKTIEDATNMWNACQGDWGMGTLIHILKTEGNLSDDAIFLAHRNKKTPTKGA